MDDFIDTYNEGIEEVLESEDFDFENIVERMKSDLTNPTSKIEGSFAMDIIQAVAMEESRAVNMRIIDYINLTMLDTAEGEFLDRKAIDYGIERIQAVPSTGYVTFIGANGTVIPANTIIESEEFTFTTNYEDVILNDSVKILCTCTEGGKETNILSENIIGTLEDIEGLESCTNEEPFSGGSDEEEDDFFRERILEKIQMPISSGNANSYIYWAKQINGVGNARVVPLWNGAGTVKVIIVSDEGLTPSDTVIKSVKDFIEIERPIGADVTVVGAEAKSVVIKGTIVISNEYKLEDIQVEVLNVITSYLTTIAFDSDNKTLSYYRISDLIFNVAGVEDIIEYTLNDEKNSLTAEADEFFQLKEVLLNEN